MPKKSRWSYKKMLFWILGLSWLSGIIFFVLNNFFVTDGEFGIDYHPAQYPILKIHGAASFIIMVTFGYLLSAHVKKSWNVRTPKSKMGIAMTCFMLGSIITAYALYYIPSMDVRKIVGYVHFTIGFLLPFILLTHIIQMKRENDRIKKISN